MSGAKITVDEWRSALEAAMHRAGDDGLTMNEIADALGCSPASARDKLAALHRAGRLISGKRPQMSIDGVTRSVPVYRLKP